MGASGTGQSARQPETFCANRKLLVGKSSVSSI